MLTTGTKGKAEVKVDDTNTAVTMGSGSLKVFATPAMIALIEKAACKALEGRVLDVHGAKSNTAGRGNGPVLTVYALVNLG